jgi:uncharacterized protein YnzC (UPF0291/DUF896 family)
LAEHVQRINKKFSEHLTRQIKEENAKLREEFTSKLEAEVRKVEKTWIKYGKVQTFKL